MGSPTTYHCGSLNYDPLEPEWCNFTETFPEAIQALGHKCRYAGFIDRFYSVLEHSLLAHELAVLADEQQEEGDPAFRMACLLHDIEEAYLDDVPSPRKKLLYYAANRYDAINGAILTASSVHSRNQQEIIKQNLKHWKVPQENIDRVVSMLDSPRLHSIDLALYHAEVICGHLIRKEIQEHYVYPESKEAFQSYLTSAKIEPDDVLRKIDVEPTDPVLLRTVFLGKFLTEARNLGSEVIQQGLIKLEENKDVDPEEA